MAPLTSAEISERQPFLGRGLDDLASRVGDLRPRVNECRKRKPHVRILEIGCGFATALLQLRLLGDPGLELHGINRVPEDGDPDSIRESARQNGLAAPQALRTIPLPHIHYLNVDDGIPFPNGYFDLVYSQVAFDHVRRKAALLQEIARVLSAGGVGLIDASIERPELPEPYRTLFEIWDHGREVSFWEYIQAIEPLQRRQVASRPYLEVRPAGALDLRLEFVDAIGLSEICRDWWGAKSIYRVVGGQG